MRVLLVRPAEASRKWLRLLGSAPPLGLAYVASALQNAGHDVRALDAVLEEPETYTPYGPIVARGLSNSSVVARITDDIEAIGITALFTVNWLLVVDLVDRIKAARPDLPVVLGGEHVSALPRFALDTSRADVVVIGEGERTAPEVFGALAAGESLEGIAGVAWRSQDGVVVNGPRDRISEIDTIAPPAWDLFDPRAYSSAGLLGAARATGRVTVPMLASRGCPYRCTYCAAPNMWTPKWVPRDPVAVVDEMEGYIRRFGAGDFPLQDLTTIIKKSWVQTFCEEILRRGLDISWQMSSGTRLEQVDGELATLLRRSGLTYLAFAPESGSEETRKRVGKRMETESIVRAVEAAVEAGLPLHLLLVLGFPEDQHRDLIATMKLAAWAGRVGVRDVGPHVFTPLPGTELWDELMSRGDIRMSPELLFSTITNFGFLARYVTTRRTPPQAVIAAQYLVTASFFASRSMFHPGQVLRELAGESRRSGSGDAPGYLPRIVSNLASLARNKATRFGRGAKPVHLPELAYDGMDAASLLRATQSAPGGPAKRPPPGRAA